MANFRRLDADKAGAMASLLCAIHCSVVGLLAGFLPLIGLTFLHEPWVEALFYCTAAVLGVWAAVRGWLLHRAWWVSLFFLCGFALVGIGHWAGEMSVNKGQLETLGHLLSAAGGLVLVAFHVMNSRLTKSHACSCAACIVGREPDSVKVLSDAKRSSSPENP